MPEPRPLVRAPELDSGKQWLNTDRPWTLAELRGKVVLLDFWTYCCINCLHVLSDLRQLEAKHPDTLAVIGVHSAKFANERLGVSLKRALQRYDIQHPVVNDDDLAIWESYAIKAWPTLVLIDPRGYIVGSVSGEGHLESLDQAITRVAEIHREAGLLDSTPLRLHAETVPGGPLCFPGKILADASSQRVFISDTNHDRVVMATFGGEVLDVIGSGDSSDRDGKFDRAGFRRPQGLAWDGSVLYVADTGNHRIRRCDPAARRVETLAGSGAQGRPFDPWRIQKASAADLNSPWDLALMDLHLFVAMAGSHQIWLCDLRTGEIGPYAGSGREGLHDGSLPDCWLAQPSGLALGPAHLFVADSEVSAIRAVPLDPSRAVQTVIGLGLFQYGDADGVGDEARLQHPLGIAYRDSVLYVADTYNHKVKRIDPATRASQTLFGDGRPGHQDGAAARFGEPGGISAAGNLLFVADTNNHAVRVADLESGTVDTLSLAGL